MRYGQDINGYLVVSKPTNANAGKCVWAFAKKDGKEYFIKEFLDPKRPRPDSMGSVADKERRYAECQRFEERNNRILNTLRADDPHAGNLVLAEDFFADGTRYYKVTRRIHSENVAPHMLSAEQQAVLLATLADSVYLLHTKGFVHGDLKPENVLLNRPARSDLYTAKLIDFDDAYPAGNPPPSGVIGGNPCYGAPEWLRYLQGTTTQVARSTLTQAVDVFAFGLLIHAYLFDALPGHDPAYESPAGAVTAGSPLAWDPRASHRLTTLLTALTRLDHAERPTIAEAGVIIAQPAVLTPSTTGRVRVNLHGRPVPQRQKNRLRVNLTGP
jgi:eukaryotic-like serine/threonine-protein kinase